MSLWGKFKNAVTPGNAMPRAVSRVEGFELSVERKEGVLLTASPGLLGTGPEDKSEPSYYEVTVRVTGENPEYPASDEPGTQRFTVGTDERASGMVNGVSYIPAGGRWTKFELVEEFDDGAFKPNVIFMGKKMPPHHTVWLRAHFRDAAGHESNMGIGGWVRKSERESEAWQRAARSSVHYI